MRAARSPLFLARDAYRRRRLTDAARLLPFVGVFLFVLPVLWQPAETPAPDTARGGLYLLVAWSLLILGAGLLSIHLRAGPFDDDPLPPSDADPNGQAGGAGNGNAA